MPGMFMFGYGIHLKVVFLLLVCFSVTGKAQIPFFQPNSNLAFRVLLIDYGKVNGIPDKLVTNGLELKYIREISPVLSLALPVKVGVAHMSDDLYNRSFVSMDALVHYKFEAFSEKTVPYALAGAGLMWDNEPAVRSQFPIGAGVNIKAGDFSFINVQAEYRVSPEKKRQGFQLGLGIVFRFKKNDSDGDGVGDLIDECPDTPGPREFNGCPDSDGDGIIDKKDDCPTEPGRRRTRGCPDRDRDGIADYEDACPDEYGYAEFKGCPQG